MLLLLCQLIQKSLELYIGNAAYGHGTHLWVNWAKVKQGKERAVQAQQNQIYNQK